MRPVGGCPGCLTLRPGFCKPHVFCHPDAALKTLLDSKPKEGKGPAKQVAGGGGGVGVGVGVGEGRA